MFRLSGKPYQKSTSCEVGSITEVADVVLLAQVELLVQQEIVQLQKLFPAGLALKPGRAQVRPQVQVQLLGRVEDQVATVAPVYRTLEPVLEFFGCLRFLEGSEKYQQC